MHWLDWTMLGLLAAAALLGARSGLVKQVFRVVGFALAGWAAVALHGWANGLLLAGPLEDADPRAASLVAYGVVFAVVSVAVMIVARLFERGVKAAKLQFYNRLLGASLASAKMVVLLASVCFALQRLPIPQAQQVVHDSAVAPTLAWGADEVVKVMPERYKGEVNDSWEQVRDKLPAPGGDAVTR
jgi:uncharacterized membrane protein required for colicin V production